MKIAITAQGSTLEAALIRGLGAVSSSSSSIWRPGTMRLPNDGAMALWGAGTQAALLIADKDAAAITGHVGPTPPLVAGRGHQGLHGLRHRGEAVARSSRESCQRFRFDGEIPFWPEGAKGRLGNENRNRNS